MDALPIEKHDFMFSGNGKQMLGHHSNSRNTAWFSLYDYEYIKTLMPAVISPQLQIISRQIIISQSDHQDFELHNYTCI